MAGLGRCPGGYNYLADLEGQFVVSYLQMKKEVINPGRGSCMSLALGSKASWGFNQELLLGSVRLWT